MNITKRKNHYQVREMRNGKVFTCTFKYKPSKLEAQTKLNELESKSFCVKKSIINAIYEYIEVKENVLSPSTIRNYYNIAHRLEYKNKDFVEKDINGLTQYEMQKFINELAKKTKAKTIKNIYGLIRASINMFVRINYDITMPKQIYEEPYIPNSKEVALLIRESQGTPYYIPIRLALYSLRRSEILGLTIDDIYDDYVLVNKAKVRGRTGMTVKTTKTRNSTRKVYIDKDLVDLIRKQGYIYNKDPDSITEFISEFCKMNDVKKFTLHKLRHYFATAMHYANIPRKTIEKIGGWSVNSPILDKIYTHSSEDFDYKNTILKIMGQALN